MPGRTRGDAAVRRVVERLFALTVDDEADARPAATSGDDGQAQIPDAGERHLSARRGASQPPQPPPPSVERTVAALKAAYAEERYADVRAAAVSRDCRRVHAAFGPGVVWRAEVVPGLDDEEGPGTPEEA